MAGLVPAIHALSFSGEGANVWRKGGHNELRGCARQQKVAPARRDVAKAWRTHHTGVEHLTYLQAHATFPLRKYLISIISPLLRAASCPGSQDSGWREPLCGFVFRCSKTVIGPPLGLLRPCEDSSLGRADDC